MFTCYAAIAPAFARTVFYSTFCSLVDAAIEQQYASDALTLFNAICGDVWRACLRNGDMRAWELFKLHCNRYAHEHGVLDRSRVLTFTWAGCAY